MMVLGEKDEDEGKEQKEKEEEVKKGLHIDILSGSNLNIGHLGKAYSLEGRGKIN